MDVSTANVELSSDSTVTSGNLSTDANSTLLTLLGDFWTNHDDGAKYIIIKVIVDKSIKLASKPTIYVSLQKYWNNEMDQLLFEDVIDFIEEPLFENTMLIVDISSLPKLAPLSIVSVDIHNIVLRYDVTHKMSSNNTIILKNVQFDENFCDQKDYSNIEGKPITGVMYSLSRLDNIEKEGKMRLKLRDEALCVTMMTDGSIFSCTIGNDSDESNYEKEWKGDIPRSLKYWKHRCIKNDTCQIILPLESNKGSISIQSDYFEAVSVYPFELKQ